MNEARYRLLIQEGFDRELPPEDKYAVLGYIETNENGARFHESLAKLIECLEGLAIPECYLPDDPEALAEAIRRALPSGNTSIFALISDVLGGLWLRKIAPRPQDKTDKVSLPKQSHEEQQPNTHKKGRRQLPQLNIEDTEINRLKAMPKMVSMDDENRKAQSASGLLSQTLGLPFGQSESGEQKTLTLAESIKQRLAEQKTREQSGLSSEAPHDESEESIDEQPIAQVPITDVAPPEMQATEAPSFSANYRHGSETQGQPVQLWPATPVFPPPGSALERMLDVQAPPPSPEDQLEPNANASAASPWDPPAPSAPSPWDPPAASASSPWDPPAASTASPWDPPAASAPSPWDPPAASTASPWDPPAPSTASPQAPPAQGWALPHAKVPLPAAPEWEHPFQAEANQPGEESSEYLQWDQQEVAGAPEAPAPQPVSNMVQPLEKLIPVDSIMTHLQDLFGEGESSESDRFGRSIQERMPEHATTAPDIKQAPVPLDEPASAEQSTAAPSIKPVTVDGFARIDKMIAAGGGETPPGKISSLGNFLLDNQTLQSIGNLVAQGAESSKLRILSKEAAGELQSMIGSLAKQGSVIGSVIIGYDGFTIASTLPQGPDMDSLGTWAMVSYMNALSVAQKIGHNKVQQLVSRTALGYVLLADFGDGLLVTLSDAADTQALLPLMRSIKQLTAHG